MYVFRKLALLALSTCGAIDAASAATSTVPAFPTKPVRVLVGFAPGGGSDTLGRLVAPRLSEQLGQPLVIDNRPGANGVIAMELAAKAPADGYTLMIASGSSVVSATLVTKVDFDINKAFSPISLLAKQPYVLMVSQSLPVKDVKDLVSHAKAKPGALNYGSSGHGSSAHLGMELFKQMAGVEMTHIAYKGIGPAITELIGGQIQLLFGSAVSAGAAVKTGKVRALAVTSARRAKSLPDLPTIAESGVPKFDLTGWYGLVAPAGVPRPIIAQLNQAVAKALSVPEVQSRLSNDGSEAAAGTPEQFAETIAREIQTWRRLMQQTSLKLQ